ncbi:MAG: hypothetical protein Q4F88_01810 [Eubacteriales bacterium]|nr:hypothetical protein [Eubacteriales bacterium]
MKKVLFFIPIFLLIISIFSFNLYAYGWHSNAIGWWFERGDGTYPKGGWELVDGNKDGTGEYYYFDEEGYIITDTICPDYLIVNKDGQRLNGLGLVVKEKMPSNYNYGHEENTNTNNSSNIFQGQSSMGVIRQDDALIAGGPEANALQNQTVVMGGVTLKYDETESASRVMADNIVGGENYDKSVTARVTGKVTWTDVMCLKGDGAYIVFKNPGFGKIKGKISHEYKASTDTTHCAINLILDDVHFSSIENFDFQRSEEFEFELPEDCKKVRLELSITGDYTARKVYLRDFVYRK